LKQLKSFGLISEAEYEERMKQLVDSLTGTKLAEAAEIAPGSREKLKIKIPAFPSRHLPADFDASLSDLSLAEASALEYDSEKKSSKEKKGDSAPASISVSVEAQRKPEKFVDEDESSAAVEEDQRVGIPKGADAVVAKKKFSMDDDPWLNARPPPDFSQFPVERAVKYVLDDVSEDWVKTIVNVRVDDEMFSKGSLRDAYHLLELEERDGVVSGINCVAKFSRDPYEDEETYFKDVRTQWFAQKFAEQYNIYNPPKPVQFIQAWVLRLIDRPSKPLCGVEAYIAGPYRKHNNNYGYVSEEERSTPQAFSHFTYEASDHKILICDVQGVNDLYTDPQIHSIDSSAFSKGNMGESGLQKFLGSHRCNAICRYLKLPSINAKDDTEQSTMPSTRFMSWQGVESVMVENSLPSRPTTLVDSESDHPPARILPPRLPPREPPRVWCPSCIIL